MIAQAHRALSKAGVCVPEGIAIEVSPALLLNQAKLKQRAMEQAPFTDAAFLY